MIDLAFSCALIKTSRIFSAKVRFAGMNYDDDPGTIITIRTVRDSIVQRSIAQYSTAQYSTAQYSTAQHSATLIFSKYTCSQVFFAGCTHDQWFHVILVTMIGFCTRLLDKENM